MPRHAAPFSRLACATASFQMISTGTLCPYCALGPRLHPSYLLHRDPTSDPLSPLTLLSRPPQSAAAGSPPTVTPRELAAMHIKQVIIEGFKSYKEQFALEEFSPRLNVVVGANGSGKSNFFHAVRFVLTDIHVQLRAEDRRSLLHEGAGHAVPRATVEVVFCNRDGRLPIDRDEVRLSRRVDLRGDSFSLNGKAVNREEVQSLLESAGLSRANPYYVVQQGRITQMTTMTDPQRLDLLKEIGRAREGEARLAPQPLLLPPL